MFIITKSKVAFLLPKEYELARQFEKENPNWTKTAATTKQVVYKFEQFINTGTDTEDK